jgi:hypothetical protein
LNVFPPPREVVMVGVPGVKVDRILSGIVGTEEDPELIVLGVTAKLFSTGQEHDGKGLNVHSAVPPAQIPIAWPVGMVVPEIPPIVLRDIEPKFPSAP